MPINRDISNGTATSYNVTFPWIDKSHVFVAVDGVDVSFEWGSGAEVILAAPAPQGSVVARYRKTPRAPLVDFRPATALTEKELDLVATQGLYLAEEGHALLEEAIGYDITVDAFNAQGLRVTDVKDPVDDQDAATKGWVNESALSVLNQAQTKAEEAQSSANDAQSSEDEAEKWAEEVEDTEVEPGKYSARHHALKAEGSKNTSDQRATEAANSASAAEGFKNTASFKATEASNSETAAEAFKNTATSKAAEAVAAAGAAGTHKTDAEGFKNTASQKATEAVTARDAAVSARAAAVSARDSAEKWADEVEDTEVEPGKYSAKHWAAKAAASSELVNDPSPELSGDLLPSIDGVHNIGSALKRIENLFLSGGAFLGGTAAANKLDYYEVGSFSPVTPNGSWTVQGAHYVRVGNLVVCSLQVNATSAISAADFTGLPFVSDASKNGGGSVTFQNEEPGESWSVLVQGASNIWNWRKGGGQKGLSSGNTVYCTFSYFAA